MFLIQFSMYSLPHSLFSYLSLILSFSMLTYPFQWLLRTPKYHSILYLIFLRFSLIPSHSFSSVSPFLSISLSLYSLPLFHVLLGLLSWNESKISPPHSFSSPSSSRLSPFSFTVLNSRGKKREKQIWKKMTVKYSCYFKTKLSWKRREGEDGTGKKGITKCRGRERERK